MKSIILFTLVIIFFQSIACSTSSHQDEMNRRKEIKNAKQLAKLEKQKRKHLERVKKINFKKEVEISFGNTEPEENQVFQENHNTGVCFQKHSSSKIFTHSLFPGIKASGRTINYLCTLIVSGHADYDGFVAAHFDLGGKKVEKPNGNKLFYFLEPVSCKKTLHKDHKSSNFDRKLYKQFYKKCGLHPYFFVFE